jgi:hypothetical protein
MPISLKASPLFVEFRSQSPGQWNVASFYMSIECRNMTMVVIDSIEKPGVHGFKAAKKFTNYGEPDTSPRVIFL